MKRLMYIESRAAAVNGRGRIGWVELLKSCRAFRYGGQTFHKSFGALYNCFDAATGERYLIAKPKVDGRDKLHGGLVDIDDDAREEYWLHLRNLPQSAHLCSFQADPRRGS